MELRRHYFSEEEMEEISLLKELCDGMLVDGKSVICFEVLDDILNSRREINSFPKVNLLTMLEQLKDFNAFWKDAEWYDNEKIETLLSKFKKVIKQELKER